MKRILSYLTCLAGLCLLAACRQGGQPADNAGADRRPVITVGIEPVRYFVEAVAGDAFRVSCLVPRGSSPETYDPTPAQLVDVARSRAYLSIGHIGFEQAWMERLRQNAPGLPVFDLSAGIALMADDAHAHAHGGHHPHAATGVEPHVWTSAVNARCIARNVLQALCSLDTARQAQFAQRHDSLLRRIDRLDRQMDSLLHLPGADSVFMIYHPALTYLARDYGLRQLSIEAGGKEPSPAQLKALIDQCRTLGVHTIFVQPEFDRRNAQLIARQTGAQVCPINPLAYDWEEEMLRIARQIARQHQPAKP